MRRTRWKQDETDETKSAAKGAEPNDDAETTPALHLKELWKDTQALLADKMLIMQRPNETNKLAP